MSICLFLMGLASSSVARSSRLLNAIARDPFVIFCDRSPRATSRPRQGGAQRGNPPLPGVSGGVPLILQNTPRAGGWEEQRPCSGDNADAPHTHETWHRHPTSYHHRGGSTPASQLARLTRISVLSTLDPMELVFVLNRFPQRQPFQASDCGKIFLAAEPVLH